MKKALIQGNRICDVVEPGQEFEVHKDLVWVDVDDDTVGYKDTWVDNKVVKFVSPTIPYTRKRAAEYPPMGDQLDALYHAGVFPDDMAAQLKAVKDKYPKE